YLEVSGNELGRRGLAGDTRRVVTRSFECADGEYVGVHSGAVGAFGRLMKVLGLEDRIPASDSGLDMGIPLTPEQAMILRDELPPLFLTAPRTTWLDRLHAA